MISRVSSISDQDFLTRYALEKKVCLFGSGFTDAWRAMHDWIDPADGKSVNVEYLQAKYGTVSNSIINMLDILYLVQLYTESPLNLRMRALASV